MKSLLFLAASALALAGAGCSTQRAATRATLDCPPVQGELTRTGVAPDRKSCSYRTAEGAEVTLQLVSVDGDAQRTLKQIEASIAPEAPATPAPPAPPAPPSPATTDETEAASDAAEAAADAAEAASEAARDAEKAAHVDIRVGHDGKTIVTEGDGETTQVDLPGVHIVAGEKDADVKIGGLRVNANHDAATVRMYREVRMRGEALSREKRGLRATFMSGGKALPGGYRFVGYQAGGPKTGPLTVAVVKSRSEIDSGDQLYRDVTRLVRANGGV